MARGIVVREGPRGAFAEGGFVSTSGSRSFLTAIVALAMLATMAEGARAGLVVPNSLETVEGDDSNILPFSIGDFGLTSMRYQQVYAASEFPEPLLITAIHFRPDALFGIPFESTLPSIQINLSTTSAVPDALSTTFADNVGLDDTIVFGQGPLTLSSSATGPIDGPKDFDITIVLTTAFSYDPSLGNLLLDVRNFAGGTTTRFDAHFVSGDPLSRSATLISDDVSSLTADFVDSAGLVTMFETQPQAVPEPSTLFLMSSGLASLAGHAWRRRRLRQRSAGRSLLAAVKGDPHPVGKLDTWPSFTSGFEFETLRLRVVRRLARSMRVKQAATFPKG
jgi:hypothetical protein